MDMFKLLFLPDYVGLLRKQFFGRFFNNLQFSLKNVETQFVANYRLIPMNVLT